ncbi:MAG: hypothetical protein ABIJ04_04810 [Bacteroidota bacterium]
MLSSEEIRSIALNLGADKCRIASIDRFSSAPSGFLPTDVYSKCKSVVVFLKRLPSDVIIAENPVPYSHTAYLLYSALDQIGLNLCSHLEQQNIHTVPVPTDVPYLYWDAENKHGMGIISLRHAAFREISCPQHARGWDIYTCNECRKVCPWRTGKK